MKQFARIHISRLIHSRRGSPRTTSLFFHPPTVQLSRSFLSTYDTYDTNDTSSTADFSLDTTFLQSYTTRPTSFGYNGLGEVVYQRTYSRPLEDGTPEQWYQTVSRVVQGTYRMQQRWIVKQGLGWDEHRAQVSAQRMFELMFEMKFLPPGRGLWAMGTAITEERQLYAALNNCAFVSTGETKDNPAAPFLFLMDASMLGVGVGFDTLAAGSIRVQSPDDVTTSTFVVPDSREGWVESLSLLLDAYFHGKTKPIFDYSAIRPAGLPIRGFGGISAGSDVLAQLHQDVVQCLQPLIGSTLTVTAVVDLMNLIGKCVVSGNVRRSAEIAFGEPDDEEYIDLKNYDKNPERAAYGWTSNNSIYARLGMDYEPACDRIRGNGEPGFAWLDNMRSYGRMNGEIDERDWRVSGGNPCLEQSLESFEMCCLVETFPARHETKEEFLETLKYAMLYAKTVTLGSTHWSKTNRVMLRNRRIGCSISGVAQFTARHGLHGLKDWCEDGYNQVQFVDHRLSEWLSVPTSIKTTSVKPSGTVSLLAGSTPGVHFPESRFYIRRVRMVKDLWMVERLAVAGYHIEPAADDPERTVVVSFPIDVGEGVRTLNDVSMWEQLSVAAFLQRHWADNQVSCTVTFDPETEGPQLSHALDVFQYQLKGISFLPRLPTGAYKQMPYEEITKEEYLDMSSALQTLDMEPPDELHRAAVEGTAAVEVPDKFCDNDSCTI